MAQRSAGPDGAQAEELARIFPEKMTALEEEIGKVMVGQRQVLRQTLVALMGGGHVLLEGVPGLGKTVLVRTLGQVFGLEFSRIQFTPDLMPADCIGTHVLRQQQTPGEHSTFAFERGPIFTNLLLADEINRATPKTQSALLEAMQEGRVTTGNSTYPLPEPFFVLATQNPLEMEGTYPLPEAQLDRFFFKIIVDYPSGAELIEISRRTTGTAAVDLKQILNGEELLALMGVARQVPVADSVLKYAADIIMATHPSHQWAPEPVARFVRYGASPRALQAVILAGKALALWEGRFNVAFRDIGQAAMPALRHRIGLNYEGQAEGIDIDAVLRELLEEVQPVA